MTNPEMTIENPTDLAYAIGRQWRPSGGVDQNGRRNARYMYWKRCEDANCVQHANHNGENPESGWVILGPERVSDMDGYTRFMDVKHCTPLPEFGTQLVEGMGSSLPENRFRQILENPRGIFAFPASQIMAYGWDTIPEVRAVRPDLPVVERIPCQYGCTGRKFLTRDDYANHITAKHSEATAATALGEAIKGSVNSGGSDSDTIAAAVVAAMQTYMPLIMQQTNPTALANAVAEDNLSDDIDAKPRRRYS